MDFWPDKICYLLDDLSHWTIKNESLDYFEINEMTMPMAFVIHLPINTANNSHLQERQLLSRTH